MQQKWEGWAEISGTVNLLQISDQFFKASDQVLKNIKLMLINPDPLSQIETIANILIL